jgi:hypothetical protein
MAKRDVGEKFINSMKARGYDNLIPSSYKIDDPLLLDKLAFEGTRLLETDAKVGEKVIIKPTEAKKLDTALGEKSKNCYIRARFKILKDMPLSRRDRIEEMEKTNNTDNPDYREFTRMIVKLGDDLSNSDLTKGGK